VVVVDARQWTGPSLTNGLEQLVQAFVLAHEFAHTAINRARAVSGGDAQLASLGSGTRQFRVGGARLVDEYRADRLAEIVLGVLLSATIDGERRPVSYAELVGPGYDAQLSDALRTVPGTWPTSIVAYRQYRLGLEEMWNCVAGSVDETLTLLSHVQAFADARTTSASEGTVLDHPDLRGDRAVELFLREPWRAFIEPVRTAALSPESGQFAAADAAAISAGEALYTAVLSRLGLTVRDAPTQGLGWCIDVTDALGYGRRRPAGGAPR
jgi:hypothetical protein